MKITIDVDSTTGAASMQNLTSAQTMPAVAPTLAPSQAMDAGSYRGAKTKSESAVVASQTFDAGSARVAPSRPPAPHRDTLTLVAGTTGTKGGLDAGSR